MAEPLNSTPVDPEERARLRVDSTVRGKWHLDALLGVGGMAAVFASTHRNGQRAALKILHVDFARDRIVCERFLREAYVSNRVGHPACVRVLDDDLTEDDEPFLVMELLEGETVRDAWKRAGRVMPVGEVLRIADVVLDCLSACHAAGVIHRDLKPANIFLTTAGEVKVLDFGVAQMRSATSERTAAGTALGTPAYMSPEQAMGLVDQLDGRADVFSVGAMIHALVSGQRINSGRTENEALVLAATTPVASVARIAPDLPVEVVALVDRAVAWDRRNRFADARAMQAAVRDALASLGPADPQQPAREAHAVPREPSRASSSVAWAGPPGSLPLPSSGPARRPSAPLGVPEPAAAENDPRASRPRATSFATSIASSPSVRQLGWGAPLRDRAAPSRTSFEAFAEALEAATRGRAGRAAVLSRGARSHTTTVWEPAPPFDSVPYNLFACGVRAIRIGRGLTFEELRRLLELLLLDPARDLPPEDDLVSALWERALAHVSCEVVDAFGGRRRLLSSGRPSTARPTRSKPSPRTRRAGRARSRRGRCRWPQIGPRSSSAR